MAGYSGTPLWQKLGYKSDFAACVEGEPADYIKMLELPREVPVK